MAQKGQIPQMISEERLIQLLNSLGERDEKHRMKITVFRQEFPIEKASRLFFLGEAKESL